MEQIVVMVSFWEISSMKLHRLDSPNASKHELYIAFLLLEIAVIKTKGTHTIQIITIFHVWQYCLFSFAIKMKKANKHSDLTGEKDYLISNLW